MLVALAGGVGAARFLRGLIRVHPPADILVIGNTGDDLRVHGLAVSPDLDSVAYTLAGLSDEERGWGLAGETWNVLGALDRLGDRDIATHLLRTRLLTEGATLSEATAEVCRRLGVPVRLVPMSDQPVETRVEVDGSERARPAPGVLDAIRAAEGIVLCPSNPVVSVAPILAVPGIRSAIQNTACRTVAITPIIGGAPVRGMADKLLPAWGVEVSARGVASLYGGLADAFVLDQVDQAQAGDVAALGLEAIVAPTLMRTPEDAAASAARLRAALASLDGHDVVVVVTDTLGRPWRRGQTDVAVGMAGMGALEDYRGQLDGDGRALEVTEVAVADEVAAAADLVKRKLARVPAALLRGVPLPAGDGRASELVRPAAEDLFRTGSGPEDLVAFLEGRRTRRRFLPDPVDPAAVERAVLAAMTAPFPHHTRPFRVVALDSGEGRKRYLTQMEAAWRQDLAADGTPAEVIERRMARSWALLGSAPVLLVPCLAPGGRHDYPDERRSRAEDAMFELAAGGAVQTLLLALHAQGLGGAWISSSLFCQGVAARALELPAGWLPLGSVAAGRPDPGDRPRPRPPLDPGDLILRR